MKVAFCPKGALIGAGVGALGGGVYGAFQAKALIDKVPVESVTHSWKEPKLGTDYVGDIPKDYYKRNGFLGISVVPKPENRPVYVKNPVVENGEVVMDDKTQTFQGHGKPVTTWREHDIEKVTGIKEVRQIEYEDSTTVTDVVREAETRREWIPPEPAVHDERTGELIKPATEGRWKEIEVEVEREIERKIIHGWEVKHEPVFAKAILGAYSTPDVRFAHGVNVGGLVIRGALLGAAFGAIAGGLIGAAVENAKNS